jgi:hypothetical protein
MSVNPQLATLMGLIDELQEQMPEGKYLEAMNALRDLHGVCPRPPPPRPEFVVPEGRIRLSGEEINRFDRMKRRRQCLRRDESYVVRAYRECKHLKDACNEANVTMLEWWAMEYEERLPIIQRTLELSFANEKKLYNESKNPDPAVCPFIARHAIGRWFDPAKPYEEGWRGKWDCVCGSKNILCRNWRQHEVSDKHQVWAKSRAVTKSKAKSMLSHNPGDDSFTHFRHMCGHRVTWSVQYGNFTPQDRNEWTHPQLFAGKPLDWVPPAPANAKLVPVYGIDPTEQDIAVRRAKYGPAVDNAHLLPLPPITYHQSFGVGIDVPQTMTEEDYAIFISMEE